MRYETLDKLIYYICGVCIAGVVLFSPPVRRGDGHEYALTARALTVNGSPLITDEVIEVIKRDILKWQPTGWELSYFTNLAAAMDGGQAYGGVFPDTAGHYYGYHFYLYSMLASVAMAVLTVFGVNPFSSFQIINGIILLGTIYIARSLEQESRRNSIHVIVTVMFSGVVFYLRWTHPDLGLWCMLFVGSLALLNLNLTVTLICITIAAMQTISLGVLIPISVTIYSIREISRLSQEWAGIIGRVVVSVIGASTSGIWYYYKFGVPSIIASIPGLIDYKLLSWNHFLSMVFDLDQGMWLASPFVICAFVWGCALRARTLSFKSLSDALIVGVITISIVMPLLSQSDVNSGQSVVQRYSLWMSAPISAWVAKNGLFWVKSPMSGAIWWVVGAGWVALWGGPFAAEDYHDFKPWTSWLLSHAPYLYRGEPGIFFTRARDEDLHVVTSRYPERLRNVAAFVRRDGMIMKILVRPGTAAVSALGSLCEGEIQRENQRTASDMDGELGEYSAGYGWTYIDGPFICLGAISTRPSSWQSAPMDGESTTVLNFASNNLPSWVWSVNGFSARESWGRWSDGYVASVVLNNSVVGLDHVEVDMDVSDMYVGSAIGLECNGMLTEAQVGQIGGTSFRIDCGKNTSRYRQYVQFRTSGAMSPRVRFVVPHGDARVLGVRVRRLSFVWVEQSPTHLWMSQIDRSVSGSFQIVGNNDANKEL